MLRRIVLCLLATLLVAACSKSTPQKAPEPAGGPYAISGVGMIAAGELDGNLVIQPEDGPFVLETYCVLGEHAAAVAPGDRVRFEGNRFTALPLKGERCLRLDLTLLESSEVPTGTR